MSDEVQTKDDVHAAPAYAASGLETAGCQPLSVPLFSTGKKKKTENSQERGLILARQFLVLTRRNIQGENTLLSDKTSVVSSEVDDPSDQSYYGQR